jgi:hypothetical protein
MHAGRFKESIWLPQHSPCFRRRKVRCNERRPRCAHCERLNLDCTWNRPVTSRSTTVQTSTSIVNSTTPINQYLGFNPNLLPLDGFSTGGNVFFDFSGPLGIGTWDEAMLLSPSSWPPEHTINEAPRLPGSVSQPIYQLPPDNQAPGSIAEPSRGGAQSIPGRGPQQPEPASTSPFSAENALDGAVDEDFLLNTFLHMLMPPILATTEIGPKWATTRAFFGSMASESPIVRRAIVAFAAMLMQRSGLGGDVMETDWRPLYDNAAAHLSNALAKKRKEEEGDSVIVPLKFVLASLFLLTYTDVSLLPRLLYIPVRKCFGKTLQTRYVNLY